MFPFKQLNTNIYAKAGPAVTQDTVYWKKLGVPTLVKEFGAIDYIDFSPAEPHNFAVTCSLRVQVYNPITKLVVKNLSQFQKLAYGGTFRKDGTLLVAGDEEGLVRLFNVQSKNILRLFKGHTAPVHRTYFTADMVHIASFSDDKTVRLWDMATEQMVSMYEGHTDYLRAGCVSPVSPNIIVSGGYDHKINMFDTRSNSKVLTVDHGSPVESVIFLPTGGIFVSAGGTEIKVWDAFNSGKLISKLSQHHKTVTCLCLGSNGRRLLSGSLDRHVKIYDVATYQPVHNIDFSNAILSLAVAEDDNTLVAGMVDGLISIQRREEHESADAEMHQQGRRSKTAKYRVEDMEELPITVDMSKQSKYNTYLRKYEYSAALDEALLPYTMNKNPHVSVAIIRELIHRKGLERALAGRAEKSLAKFLIFVNRYITDHRFTRIMIDAGNIFLNVYEEQFNGFSRDFLKIIVDLTKKLKREEQTLLDMLSLQGGVDLLLAGCRIGQEEVQDLFHTTSDYRASENAKLSAVINVDD